MDLKIDDLLEKRQENITALDLEYVSLDVDKVLNLLNKTFRRK
jgi:Ras GTPase-activating-like protein IQGAP2/3